MILWCKCGTFMGLREPVKDWVADRSGLCPECARTLFDMTALARKGIDLEVAPLKPSAGRAEVAEVHGDN
jgi:hypothetical protein